MKLILFWLQDHHHHNHSLCQRSSSWRRPGGFWNSGCTRAPASLRTSPSSSVLTLPKMAMLKCDSSIFALGNQVPLMGNPPSISCEGHCQHDYCTFSPFRNLPFSQTSKGLFETLPEQDSLQKPPPPKLIRARRAQGKTQQGRRVPGSRNDAISFVNPKSSLHSWILLTTIIFIIIAHVNITSESSNVAPPPGIKTP